MEQGILDGINTLSVALDRVRSSHALSTQAPQLRQHRRDTCPAVRHERWGAAARHYLINSTRQINPRVLKKLKGNAGKTGLSGQQGPAGVRGATGAEGAKGTRVLGFVHSAIRALGERRLRLLPRQHGYERLRHELGELSDPARGGSADWAGRVYADVAGRALRRSRLGRCGISVHLWRAAHRVLVANDLRLRGIGNLPGAGRFGLVMEWTVEAEHAFEIGTYTVTAG